MSKQSKQQATACNNNNNDMNNNKDKTPSMLARYTCASVVVAVFGIWGKYTFVDEESQTPGVQVPMHSFQVPLVLTTGYLVSLPILKYLVQTFLAPTVDVKLLLKESMVVYNLGQVLLNGWMVYRFLLALWLGHPFVGDISTVQYGTTYAVWVHYCDKYLEFLDTYFMVLRGKMDQVSFLHIYHHTTIAWAWWAGMSLYPAGDAYFGALLNSWIHVMMYSYYTLSLLQIQCPWKRYLTMAQLLQFASVVVYSVASITNCFYDPEARWNHVLAIVIQVGEMVSLFVLFSQFYKKSYRTKKKKKQHEADSTKDVLSNNSDEVKNNTSTSSSSEDDSVTDVSSSSSSSGSNSGDVDDQCHKAIQKLATTTNDMIEIAAKDANTFVHSAKHSLESTTRQPLSSM